MRANKKGRSKVLLIVTKGNWGGAQRYVYDLAVSLPRNKFDPTVMSGEGDILDEKLRLAGIPSVSEPRMGRDVRILSDLVSLFGMWRTMRRLRPDVVHLNSSKAGGLGALAARLARVPKIVFTVHGFAFNERHRGFLSQMIIRFLSWLTLLLCHTAIFISSKELSQAERWPFVGKKLKLVPNGISSPAFLPKEEARKALSRTIGKPAGFLDQKTVIGTIAELTPNKDISTALKAIAEHPSVTYSVIGSGESADELKRQVQDLGIADRTHFAGFVDSASKLIPAFDIFLLTSRKEGLPYVILEAGMAGVPVIATNVGGIPDIISCMETGILVRPGRPNEVSEAIKFLLKEKRKASSYASKLKKKVLGSHSVKAMVAATEKIYIS